MLLALGLGRAEVLRLTIRDVSDDERQVAAMLEPVTRTTLYDGSPDDVSAGDVYDMVWCDRRDGWVEVTVNVTLEDGETVVRRSAGRVRVTREWNPGLGFVTLRMEADVELLPEGDPEAALELGRITEDEYWDIVDPG